MNYSKEIQARITAFAKEQSQYYLDDAEMTYIEKLRQKTGQTKRKISRQLARFKISSEQATDAQNDMVLYMNDHINDLIAQGVSEDEAFLKACEAMKFASGTQQESDIQERFLQYYQNYNPQDFEAIGLFYAAFFFIGIIIGGLTGYILSGGRTEFLAGGWIDTLVGTGVGLFLGLGLGLLGNAIIALKRKV